MEPILGQDEINAVLEAIKGGGLTEPEGGALAPTAVAYDLTTNQRVARGRMPGLEIVNDRQARFHRTSLSALAQRVVEVSYRSTGLHRFGEIQSNLPTPSCLSVVHFSPLSGQGIIAFDSDFLFGILDILCGGTGSSGGKQGVSELTGVESRLARRMVEAVLGDMDRAWGPVVGMRGQFVRTETNPRFAAIAAPGDVMLDVVYDVEIEDALTGVLHVIIPHASLMPFRSQLSSVIQGGVAEDQAEQETWLKEHILRVFVEPVAMLGSTRLRLSEILDLKEGDLLTLASDAKEPVGLMLEGVEVTAGHPVVVGGNIGLNVVEPVCGEVWRAFGEKLGL